MARDFLRKKQDWILILILAASLWIVHYWNHNLYGLYEDDLTIIPQALQMSMKEVFSHVSDYILTLSGQGRPLHHSFIYLFSNMGYRINGLSGIYLIGYFIELANAILLYALIRRIHPSRGLAFLVGMAFVLFPADTTKIYLTHSLGLHPSILFILLGFHFYISGKWVPAYFFAALSTICYESVFPIFITAPLLAHEWSKKLGRRAAIHALVMIGIISLVFSLRVWVGETRVSSLLLSEIIMTPLIHMLQGPIVAMGTFLYRPVQVILSIDPILSTGIFGISLALAIAISKWVNADERTSEVVHLDAKIGVQEKLIQWFKDHQVESRLLLSGSAMVVFSYALTFTTRAYAITGRDTRVHAAAIIGSSLVVGVISHLGIKLRRPISQRIALFAVVLLFTFLSVFGFQVQQEYVSAWRLQQAFWRDLIPLIEDVEPGTVVIVDPNGMEDTHQIWANHWNLPRVLVQLYNFPDSWSIVPRVYRLIPDWEPRMVNEEGLFEINSLTVVAPPSTYQEVESNRVVFIQQDNGQWVRHPYSLVIDDVEYPLKPVTSPTLPNLEEGFLYRLLFD